MRVYAWRSLKYLTRDVEAATPALIKYLKHPSAEVRTFAVETLCNARVQPPEAIGPVADCLKDPARSVRSAAAVGLRGYGSRAKAGVPALTNALQDFWIRDSVARTLKTIDPDAAAKAGVE